MQRTNMQWTLRRLAERALAIAFLFTGADGILLRAAPPAASGLNGASATAGVPRIYGASHGH
jgi:hypothetical protein